MMTFWQLAAVKLGSNMVDADGEFRIYQNFWWVNVLAETTLSFADVVTD